MGCCGCCRKKEQKLDVAFSKHKCTDVICLALFGAVWFVTITIFLAAGRTADTAALTFGRDYNGDVCGSETTHPGAKAYGCDEGICTQVYYPKVNEDVAFSVALNASFSLFGICLPNCPKALDVVCTYNYTDTVGIPTYDETIKCSNLIYRALHENLCSNCWVVPLNTTTVMNRCMPVVTTDTTEMAHCVVPESPTDPSDPNYIDPNSPTCLAKTVIEQQSKTQASNNDVMTNMLLNVQVFIGRYVSDIQSSYVVLAMGVLVSFVAGFLFLSFLKSCSKCVIWTVIVCGLLLCILATIYLYYAAGILQLDGIVNTVIQEGDKVFHWGNTTFNSIVEKIPDYLMSTENTKQNWAIAAYVMTAFTIILFFVVLAMGHSVNVSIAIMKEATTALSNIPSLLLVPIIVSLLSVCILLFFVSSLGLSYSSSMSVTDYTNEVIGTIGEYVSTSNNTNFICQDPVNQVNCTLLGESFSSSLSSDVILTFYHIFAFCWSSQFINAIGVMTVAGTIGKWYFSQMKKDEKIGMRTVSHAFLCTVMFHMGSAAYGAFLIACVQLARAIMLYIDEKTKKSQSSNPLVKCGVKCCHCCLLCLEKCMKYISRNAYIMVINRNLSFFKASVESFGLLAHNLKVVSTLKSVSTLFIWMGTVSNCMISGFFVTYMIYYQPQWLTHPLISAVGPVVIAVVLAYIINSIFMNVFVITLDTILLCYCMDRKHGTDHGVSPEEVAEWSNSRRTGTFAVMEQEMTETQVQTQVQEAHVQEIQDLGAVSTTSASTSSAAQPVISKNGVMDLGSMPMA